MPWCGAWRNSRSFGASTHAFTRVLSHNISLDVLSEPDDSYPMREPKKTRKTQDMTDPSGGIGAFFRKPPALALDSEEDIAMNESEAAATAGVESTGE